MGNRAGRGAIDPEMEEYYECRNIHRDIETYIDTYRHIYIHKYLHIYQPKIRR